MQNQQFQIQYVRSLEIVTPSSQEIKSLGKEKLKSTTLLRSVQEVKLQSIALPPKLERPKQGHREPESEQKPPNRNPPGLQLR